MPHSAVKGMTPYEAFYGKKLTISYLQPFGKAYYVYIPEDRRPSGSKLLLHIEKGVFFAYTDSSSIYKLHILAQKHTLTISVLDVNFHQMPATQHTATPQHTPTQATQHTASQPTPTVLTSIYSNPFPNDSHLLDYYFQNPEWAIKCYDRNQYSVSKI